MTGAKLQSFLKYGGFNMSNIKRNRKRYSKEFTFRPRRFNFNRKKIIREIFNWFLLVLGAAIAGYALITFIVQTVTVVGPSMSNTLQDGQVVIVNKLSYKFNDVERYDIIAYSEVEKNSYYDIKRVIGLPEETVQIVDGYVYINGNKLEDLPFDDYILSSGNARTEIVLGENEYFVLGDNINNSEDSRYTNIGNISKSEILGKVVYVYSPKESRGKIK